VSLSALEETMLMFGKTPNCRLPKKADPNPTHPKAAKSAAAYCPGRSPGEPCKEGPKDRYGVIKPAPLGITVDQVQQLEQNTGRPARCLKCSEPKEEPSP
jgi:hypothetical protein